MNLYKHIMSMNKHLLRKVIFIVSVCFCFSKLEAQNIGFPIYEGMFRLENKCQTEVYYYFQDTIYRLDSNTIYSSTSLDFIPRCISNPEMLKDLPYIYEEGKEKGVKRIRMWILPGIVDKKTCNGLYYYTYETWDHSEDNPKIAKLLGVHELGWLPSASVWFKGFIYENGKVIYLSNDTLNNNLELLNRIRHLFDPANRKYSEIENEFATNTFKPSVCYKFGIPDYKWTFFQKLVNKMKDIGSCKCDR